MGGAVRPAPPPERLAVLFSLPPSVSVAVAPAVIEGAVCPYAAHRLNHVQRIGHLPVQDVTGRQEELHPAEHGVHQHAKADRV
jgi:hypothetical protein